MNIDDRYLELEVRLSDARIEQMRAAQELGVELDREGAASKLRG